MTATFGQFVVAQFISQFPGAGFLLGIALASV
jgi:hypothetical protein